MPRRNRRHDSAPAPLAFGPRPPQRVTCESKERYGSEAEARSIALMNAPRGRAAATTPYRCEICGAWHLTTRGPSRGP